MKAELNTTQGISSWHSEPPMNTRAFSEWRYLKCLANVVKGVFLEKYFWMTLLIVAFRSSRRLPPWNQIWISLTSPKILLSLEWQVTPSLSASREECSSSGVCLGLDTNAETSFYRTVGDLPQWLKYLRQYIEKVKAERADKVACYNAARLHIGAQYTLHWHPILLHVAKMHTVTAVHAVKSENGRITVWAIFKPGWTSPWFATYVEFV